MTGLALPGSGAPPPLTLRAALTAWQLAPLVSAGLIAVAVIYLASATRVRQRHPARPWPAWRSLCFAAGLATAALATQSSIGVYDDVLFSVHMLQHVLLIMVAPPLLVTGRPVTLALHAWRNPFHTRLKRAVRSPLATALTWPPGVTAAYALVVAGTHTPPVMDLVLRNSAVHDAEHALYLVTGYLFFLPVLGAEPIRHRVSTIGAYLMMLLAMMIDSATGVVFTFQSREVFAPYAHTGRTWGPSLVTDLHLGGVIMLAGSDVAMTAIAIGLAVRFLRTAGRQGEPEGHLAAYNAYLSALSAGSPAAQAPAAGRDPWAAPAAAGPGRPPPGKPS